MNFSTLQVEGSLNVYKYQLWLNLYTDRLNAPFNNKNHVDH